ncbi:MAG TPA: hypothetical protein VGG27_09690 [Magnetospirillaceae bacterium]|jgi:sulfate adenylyltransferase subunit 1 (EFTu-like GTPase family)
MAFAAAALCTVLCAGSALADQSSFEIDYNTCLGAQAEAAQKLHVAMAYSVFTPTRRDFTIATTSGRVTMSCDRQAQTLTVVTPPGVSIQPYIAGN